MPTYTLSPGDPPEGEEVVDNVGVLELDVVDVSVGLTVEGQGRRLALRADGVGPLAPQLATAPDLQVDVQYGTRMVVTI